MLEIIIAAILLFPDTLSAEPRAQTVKIMCGKQMEHNATAYVPNFVATMENISTQMRTSGFGEAITGSGLDTNYGLAQCYGDLSLLDCVLCYAEARTDLPQCFPVNGGRIFLDGLRTTASFTSIPAQMTVLSVGTTRVSLQHSGSLLQAVSAAPQNNGYGRAQVTRTPGLCFGRLLEDSKCECL